MYDLGEITPEDRDAALAAIVAIDDIATKLSTCHEIEETLLNMSRSIDAHETIRRCIPTVRASQQYGDNLTGMEGCAFRMLRARIAGWEHDSIMSHHQLPPLEETMQYLLGLVVADEMNRKGGA